VAFDRNFNLISKFGKHGTESSEFDRPVDICHYAGNLYVLDCKNKRVQEFDCDGGFKRQIVLSKAHFIDSSVREDTRLSMLSTGDGASLQKRPLRIDVCEDTIAVIDDFEHLFLYNFAGELKQTIKHCRIMCFVDAYLFICDGDGNLSVYEKSTGTDKFIHLLKRNIDIFKPPISFMKFFNGHLVVSLGGSKKGVAVL
jgi:hypothetical protein